MDEDQDVSSLLAEADALLRIKRYDAAIERARSAAVRAPLDPRSYLVQARAFYEQGEFDISADLASEAIGLDPTSADGHILKSRALAASARKSSRHRRSELGQEAVRSAQESVRLAPRNPNSHMVLAQSQAVVKNFVDARAAAREAVALSPNDAATWVTASLVAINARNWDEGVEASQRALAIDPGNYAALNNLGVALRGQRKPREANAVFAQAAQANPDGLAARHNLSRAGIRVARIAILVILIPVGLVAHVGITLYLVFAVGSNLLISKYPAVVLRMERWAVPIALFFRKRDKDQPMD